MKPKSINSLMSYMRNVKGIDIKHSTQKRKLRYMGYFHGYKGYRYFNSPTSIIAFTEFNQLQAVYDFDMNLKAMLYPQIMFLETTIKNYALECILKESKSEKFADIFAHQLTAYREQANRQKQKEALSRRLKLREHIYSVISREVNRPIVSHYYSKDKPVPIWAIFELISLGEFYTFISCLKSDLRKNISKSLGLNLVNDSDGKIICLLISPLISLRNAVAHNGAVFDTRFKSNDIGKRVSEYLEKETSIKNISFDTIVDYVILIAFLMKTLCKSKTEILSFIKQFESICEVLYNSVPMNIFSRIVYTDTREKLKIFKEFIRK